MKQDDDVVIQAETEKEFRQLNVVEEGIEALKEYLKEEKDHDHTESLYVSYGNNDSSQHGSSSLFKDEMDVANKKGVAFEWLNNMYTLTIRREKI